MVRKATEADIPAVTAIYDALLDREEQGLLSTGWTRGVYPTEQTARDALRAGTLYVMEREGRVTAAAKIDQSQMEQYSRCRWQHDAPPEQVLVVHTLCIPPSLAGQGLGRECVSRIKQHAAAIGCAAIRLDTWAGNTPAARLYQKNGFSLCGRAEVLFQGRIPEELIFLEYQI